MKKYIITTLNIILAGYFVFAITAFNNPDPIVKKCVKVNIDVADNNTNGFLDAKEIKSILKKNGIYPLGKKLEDVSLRMIENTLKSSPFVNTAECSQTIDGHVQITVTQRSPIVRVKSIDGSDYYIDENGGIMPQSKYTSDLIIVTGHVTKTFAQNSIRPFVQTIMKDELWRNQIVQVNVLENHGIEVVPRVGDHIVFVGYLPEETDATEQEAEIIKFTQEKFDRLEKFYKHGLSVVGWNKYQRIDIQFNNQIICKKHPAKPHPIFLETPSEPTAEEAPAPQPEPAEQTNKEKAKKTA